MNQGHVVNVNEMGIEIETTNPIMHRPHSHTHSHSHSHSNPPSSGAHHNHNYEIQPDQETPPEALVSTAIATGSSQDKYDRTLKVAKKGYSDHGTHGVVLSQQQQSQSMAGPAPTSTSTSTLALESNRNSHNNSSSGSSSTRSNSSSSRSSKKRMSPTKDNTSHISGNGSGGGSSNNTSTINTNTNTNTNSSNKPTTSLLHAALQQQDQLDQDNDNNKTKSNSNSNKHKGECLTNPIEPSSNNNLDNIEGNLIVYKNDLIRVSNQNVHLHQTSNSNSSSSPRSSSSSKANATAKEKTVSELKQQSDPLGITTYQVLGLLGQGTFAQVFKCKNIQTNEICAVKIVKNKPAYTRQAAIEIDIFIALSKENGNGKNSIVGGIGGHIHSYNNNNNINGRSSSSSRSSSDNHSSKNKDNDHMVSLLSYFMYNSHLCLVFELLGLNLYELLKRRQFRGLPIDVVRNLVKQAVHGTNILNQKNIVHCDLKPENILVVSNDDVECMVNGKNNGVTHGTSTETTKLDAVTDGTTTTTTTTDSNKKCCINCNHDNHDDNNTNGDKERKKTQKCNHKIKLIDFGSACFEGQAAHTYIQSRFYRSPEVLIGLDYDSAIDMWSLGCVAAELFLGLPILPGIHEHDQLGRICEMIGPIPEWMLEQGKKSSKYFTLEETKPTDQKLNIIQTKELTKSTWRRKTREEFINMLSEEEKKRCGGQSKLEQQPTNRYFKKKLLGEIVTLHGKCSTAAEKESLILFVHFLKGILNPDPCERWTAFQASTHPFLTGITFRRKSVDDKVVGKGKLKITDEIHWSTPWDPSVCRRILSLKRRKRTGPSNLHKSLESHNEEDHGQGVDNRSSQLLSPTTRVIDMAGALSISFDRHRSGLTPPNVNLHQPYGGSIPQSYHAPSSANPPVSVGSLPLHMAGSNSTHYMQPPVGVSLHKHFDVTDVPIVSDQLMVPNLPINIGAQSFSGAFHSTGVAHRVQGDLGYALQRPGVVPTGSGVGHINQVPQLNPMYMHHHQQHHQHQHQPPQYVMPPYVNSSSYNGHSSDMGHFSSSSYTGVPTHFAGPLSPHNHHMSTPQDQYRADGTYPPPYGSGQMQPSQQYQMHQHEGRGYNEPRRGSSWSNYQNYRGSSM